jgi:resuscitation-promoting factor RpfB
MSLKFLGFALVLMLIVQVINIGYTANSYNPVVDYKIVTSGQKIQLTRSRFDIVKNNAKILIENKEVARLEKEKQLKVEEERKQRQIEEERKKAAEAKKQQELADAKKKSDEAKTSSNSSTPPSSNLTGSKQDWMAAAGIPQSDWTYTDFIVSRESGWNPSAKNPSSGACGLAQALPCAKTGCAAYNDPVCALKWQFSYVKARYGGYAGAYSFWSKNHWY